VAARPVVIETDKPSRVVTGAEAVKAAEAMARMQRNWDLWPYPWVFPPPDGERVHVEGIIPAPAAATQTIVTSYTVDNGFNFILWGIFQVYSGGGFILGAPDITWVLDINEPLGGGVVQGYPVQGFQSSNIPKGALLGGSLYAPYLLPKPEILSPTDTLRSKVTTTVNIPQGAPNYFITVFLGWKIPYAK